MGKQAYNVDTKVAFVGCLHLGCHPTLDTNRQFIDNMFSVNNLPHLKSNIGIYHKQRTIFILVIILLLTLHARDSSVFSFFQFHSRRTYGVQYVPALPRNPATSKLRHVVLDVRLVRPEVFCFALLFRSCVPMFGVFRPVIQNAPTVHGTYIYTTSRSSQPKASLQKITCHTFL